MAYKIGEAIRRHYVRTVTLASISESEYPGVYMDAFARYYIDENCLFRYANRRKSAKKIKKLLHDKTDIILKTKE